MSDDGSTDDTVAIARDYERRDPRFSVFVQPVNLNYGNFRFLLGAAKEPFFVYLAGDDWWEPTFLQACIEGLTADPDAVCVTTKVRFDAPDGHAVGGDGTRTLDGSLIDRLARYLRNPLDNSRMYGVFRLATATRAFPVHDYFAFDWCFSAASLLEGTHREVPSPLLNRELTPSSAYIRYVRRDNKTLVTRLFPLLPLTMDLIRRPGFPMAWPVLRALLLQNLDFHLAYARHSLPRYHRFAEPILLRIIWRFGK